MIQADRLETERADAKNSLEEYVYDMRDKLSTSLEQYMPEAVSCAALLIIVQRLAIYAGFLVTFFLLQLLGCNISFC